MGRSETRLKELEKVIQPKEEILMVYFSDWKPGEEPPDEEIEVHVSYCGNSKKKPETMTMAEYKKRFPDWEDEPVIRVSYEDDLEQNEQS